MTERCISSECLNDTRFSYTLSLENFSVIAFTLTCSEENLLEWHKKHGDKNECSFFWLHKEPHPGDYVINTDNKTVEQVVEEMKGIIDGGEA